MGLFASDQAKAKKRADKYRELIRKEAVIGGTLFGPVPKNGRREFFCLDQTTWVWHEEWVDSMGQKHIQTTRYDVRPDGIVKCKNDGHYTKVSPTEAQNLLQAARLYEQRIKIELYSNAS